MTEHSSALTRVRTSLEHAAAALDELRALLQPTTHQQPPEADAAQRASTPQDGEPR